MLEGQKQWFFYGFFSLGFFFWVCLYCSFVQFFQRQFFFGSFSFCVFCRLEGIRIYKVRELFRVFQEGYSFRWGFDGFWYVYFSFFGGIGVLFSSVDIQFIWKEEYGLGQYFFSFFVVVILISCGQWLSEIRKFMNGLQEGFMCFWLSLFVSVIFMCLGEG